jgi:hypothetical protein
LYGIGSSAGEITADHARSTALSPEDRFIQQRPVEGRRPENGDRNRAISISSSRHLTRPVQQTDNASEPSESEQHHQIWPSLAQTG